MEDTPEKTSAAVTSGEPGCHLENEPIMHNLFKFLPAKDLLNARLVHKTWNAVATSVLSQRKTTSLIIEGAADSSTDQLPAQSINGDDTKSLKRIKESELVQFHRLPCSQFKFNKVKLRSPVMKSFLKAQGPLITHLELVLRLDTKLSSLLTLLENQVPNLEYLKLEDVPTWENVKGVTISEQLGPLPKLKTLAFKPVVPKFWDLTPSWLVEGLLKSAENLEEVEYFPLNLVKLLEETHKVHTLKELYFYVKDQAHMHACGWTLAEDDFDVAYYVALSKMNGLKLRMLDNAFTYKLIEFPSAWGEAEVALKSILNSSKETLREFFTQACGFMESVRIPPLTNLRKLSICVRNDDPLSCGGRNGIRTVFPPGTNISKSFPSLQSCSVTCSSDQSLSICFPPAMFKPCSLPWVMTLQLDFSGMVHPPTLEELKQFFQVFPNVTELTMVSQVGRLSQDLEALWSGPWGHALSSVQVNVRKALYSSTDRDLKLPTYPFLDEVITGIPEGKCQKLRKNLQSKGKTESFRKFTVRSSVCDLKKLKVLGLVFEDKTYQNLQRPLISKLSFEFCSALQPPLKLLTVSYDPNSKSSLKA